MVVVVVDVDEDLDEDLDVLTSIPWKRFHVVRMRVNGGSTVRCRPNDDAGANRNQNTSCASRFWDEIYLSFGTLRHLPAPEKLSRSKAWASWASPAGLTQSRARASLNWTARCTRKYSPRTRVRCRRPCS